jgi:hypothetical protein
MDWIAGVDRRVVSQVGALMRSARSGGSRSKTHVVLAQDKLFVVHGTLRKRAAAVRSRASARSRSTRVCSAAYSAKDDRGRR